MIADAVPNVFTWSIFRWTGVIVGLTAWLIVTYELTALLTPLPTLSRLTQGLRDGGHREVVFLFSLFCVCIFAIFGAWLYYHFNYQARSGN
jgi:hypothetical protein